MFAQPVSDSSAYPHHSFQAIGADLTTFQLGLTFTDQADLSGNHSLRPILETLPGPGGKQNLPFGTGIEPVTVRLTI